MNHQNTKFIEVLGAKMHYVEQGEGDPILFLHGLPASSYLWRHVLPTLSRYGHCIALDLIGCGQSAKPDIDYTVFDHIRYVEAFVEALNLKRITLVLHGWGSVIGLGFAMQHWSLIKGLVFMEAHIRPTTDWNMVPLPIQELASHLHSPDRAYEAIVKRNALVENVLPRSMLHQLSPEDMAHYRAPFPDPESRKVLWQYVQEIPLGDKPNSVTDLIKKYSEQLQASQLPKLMFYAVPGFNTPIDTVQWAKMHLHHLTLVDVGDDLHYLPETNPEKICEGFVQWYETLK